MKKYLWFLFILCSHIIWAQEINVISTDAFLKLSNTQKLQILDARSEEEFDGGYIKGATNINVYARNFEKEIKYFDTNKPIYIYCYVGDRTTKAAEILATNKFKNIYTLEGGLKKWRAEKKPVFITAISAPQSMTVEEYKKVTTSKKNTLVMFTANWCAPCKILKPKLQEIATSNAEILEVVYVDVDMHKQLADALRITNIPELRYYRSGKQKWKLIGDQSKSHLIKKIKL
jgi:thioredoxin 1